MDDSSLSGKLLVASPMLRDPNFEGTVVLLLMHSTDGAFGLVLNRPSATPIGQVLPDWVDLCSGPAVVFAGGPVEEQSALALGLADGSQVSSGWSRMLGRLGTVDLNQVPEQIGDFDAVRVFVGYAGWGAGQLDGELALGGWIVADSHATDAFDPEPATLWGRVLRRQTGELRWVALHPTDLSCN